jgi:ubiquinone/menaquinone biosynthesis C-methylase UbiE
MNRGKNKQFNEYAEIYDELFSAAMDYEKEVEFCDKILRKNNCKCILEVGCGTGNRGKLFINKGYEYTGLDISEGMLRIARKKYPELRFIQGDVRKLSLKEKFDSVIFLGVGSAYLITDDDVVSALKSMKKLVDRGVIIIDGFDADFIIPNFKKNISWSKQVGSKTITRKSINKLSPNYHNAWDRQLTYIVDDDGVEKKYTDSAILRAFSGKELKTFFANVGIISTSIVHNNNTVIAIAKISG